MKEDPYFKDLGDGRYAIQRSMIIALEDSESTEISEIDSKDAETGSEEVDESSLDKVWK